MKKTDLKKRKWGALIVLATLILILIGAGIYFFNNKSPKPQVNNDTQDFIAEIGKLIELPMDEPPTLATITDIEKLSDRPFFAKAQNGDKFLVYKNSKMAILYRPSINKIIKVGTITLEDTVENGPPASPVPTSSAPVKVTIYNGTKTAGLAKSMGNSLISKFTNIELEGTGNAAGEYTENLVIDITGRNKELAGRIAAELGGEVGSLPIGEEKPQADILVILGSRE